MRRTPRWVARAAVGLGATVFVLGTADRPASAAPDRVVATPAALSSGVVGLSQGARGPAVTELQQALLDLGLPVSGGADGVFGPGTDAAVREFQRSADLPETGVVDQATVDAISSASGTDGGPGGASDAPDPANPYVGLAEGARGPAVTTVQQALIDRGTFVAGGADGVFGPATARAVRQYQSWNQLEPTGTITPPTADLLGLAAGSPPAEPTDAPPAPDAPAPDSTNPYVGLAQGDRGPLVADLQRALQSSGLVVPGGADGVFGPATATTLRAFEQVNSLPQDAVVGDREAELLALGASTPGDDAPPSDAPTPNPYVGLAVGARGDLVRDVQQALLDADVTVRGGADGVFGPATREALTGFQQANDLPADGIVNAPTVDQLGLGTDGGPIGAGNPNPDAPSAPEPTSNNPYVGLRRGDVGPLVVDLQEALQNTGLVVRGGADGVFGSATESSLKAFQSVNGIPQTGVVTERGADILRLGTPSDDGPVGTENPNPSGWAQMERFPVQGVCFFGDTWHAPRGNGRLHVGVDVIADEGNLLYAVVDGEISRQYWDYPGALAGNGLRVLADDGTYFTYLHMSGFAPGIEVGTEVSAGDVIGWVGNTGSSATAHLHFEIHPFGGAAINPFPYIEAIDECDVTDERWQVSYPVPDEAAADGSGDADA